MHGSLQYGHGTHHQPFLTSIELHECLLVALLVPVKGPAAGGLPTVHALGLAETIGNVGTLA